MLLDIADASVIGAECDPFRPHVGTPAATAGSHCPPKCPFAIAPEFRLTGSINCPVVTHRPIRPLDLVELHTLVVCADTGSFAAAGDQLGVSRVAVTKRMTNLEALAGQPLLERSSRGVRLTQAGARLCSHARVALQHSDEMTQFVATLRGERPRSGAGVRSLFADNAPTDRVSRGPEAQLAEVHQLFEHVFDVTETGLVMTGMDDGIIFEVNKALCQFLGRGRDEVIGKSTVSLRIWESLEDRERLMSELRETGSCSNLPVRVRRPDGEVRFGEASAQVLTLGGRSLIIGTLVDVSSNHAADAARLDADRWRMIARFGADVGSGLVAVSTKGATDLLVNELGHSSAAVIVPSAGEFGVLAQSGAADWSQWLDDLPGIEASCRPLRPKELAVFGGNWGCVAPIGNGGILITVADDEAQRDPSRIEAVASIVRSSLESRLSDPSPGPVAA
jgi:PAS domain S-box-containing protein